MSYQIPCPLIGHTRSFARVLQNYLIPCLLYIFNIKENSVTYITVHLELYFPFKAPFVSL
jgi:hypothetical protein